MLVFGIIVLVLLLIALLRFGVILEYSDVGFEMWVKVGPFKRSMESDFSFSKGRRKKKPKEKRPGQLASFMDSLKAVKNTLSRLRRKLLVKKLILYYTSASDNPVNTALNFGVSNAVFGTIIPILERSFRIKDRDLRAGVDFTTEIARIYAKIHISIAIWEAIYVLFALLPMLMPKRGASKATRRAASRSAAADS